ncbi:GNAT family N-acetyltransferase [Aggregatilinea lenta]|uniref:GNAT family N-acetyltransferase n=1 Tax=Aggregatilinea lenta TaxID=913108 RepID=UPI000E5AB9C7|nr:GNAT family protein [Aggregatilinea lenta]
MLEGLLVDLVPYGDAYKRQEYHWRNSEAWFWATAGDRWFLSREHSERSQRERAERAEQHHWQGIMFGIQSKDGQPLGDIGMGWVVPHHRLAMLGAAIGEPAFWGGGYGTDALLLLVDYAFDWLDFHKLWLGTMGINERVQRQMAKVGFTLEVRLRAGMYANGQWTDELQYGLLREEWPGREAVIARIGLKARSAPEAG